MDIFDQAIANKIDYNELKSRCNLRIVNKGPVDISIVIPVHGRMEFNLVITHFLQMAIDFSKINVAITFVEHDDKANHDSLCGKGINYIFIPLNGQRFNKSLCFNAGALFSVKADFYLMHDVDTIMDKWFFSKLFINMMGKDAVQAFTKRRLLMCGQKITENVLKDFRLMKGVPAYSPDIKPAQAGAAGGSIFLSRDIFFNIGGWWEVFTEYSIEDQTAYDMLYLSGTLGHCDHPSIEMFHLWHEPSFFKRTKQKCWDFYHAFKELPIENKKEFIQLRSDLLKPYISETVA